MFPSSPCLDDDAFSGASTPCDENDEKEFGVDDELLNKVAAFDPTSLVANPVSVHILHRIVLLLFNIPPKLTQWLTFHCFNQLLMYAKFAFPVGIWSSPEAA